VTDPASQRRNAVNKIFGESLPDVTSDERDDRLSEDEAAHDRWLRDNVPPHHD
jgi:hypothetical protein